MTNPNFIKAIASKKEQLIAEKRPVIANKESFFYPSKLSSVDRSYFRPVNFNGQLMDQKNQKIFCGSLAYYWLEYDKKSMSGLSFRESLLKPNLALSCPSLYQDHFSRIDPSMNGKAYYLFSPDNIGSALSEAVKQLPLGDRTKLLFYSENHVMALKVWYQGPGMVRVKCYDPNSTLMYKNACFPNLMSVAQLSISDFLTDSHIKLYFPTAYASVLVQDPSQQKVQRKSKQFKIIGKVGTLEQWYFGLRFGCFRWLEEALKGSIAVETLLTYSAEEENYPLVRAVWQNHNHSLKCLLKVFRHRVESASLYECLSKINHPYNNAFYYAFLEGKNDLIRTLTEGILQLNLSIEQKFKLLQACGEDSSGLCAAFSYNKPSTIKAFITPLLKTASLAENEIVQLLACQFKQSMPGFHHAFKNGYIKCMDIFMDCLLGNNHLTNASLVYLLMARAEEGSTAFESALVEGKEEAIQCFMKNILKSNRLIEREKVDLLVGLNQYNEPAITELLAEPESKILTLYLDTILDSNLAIPVLESLHQIFVDMDETFYTLAFKSALLRALSDPLRAKTLKEDLSALQNLAQDSLSALPLTCRLI